MKKRTNKPTNERTNKTINEKIQSVKHVYIFPFVKSIRGDQTVIFLNYLQKCCKKLQVLKLITT